MMKRMSEHVPALLLLSLLVGSAAAGVLPRRALRSKCLLAKAEAR
jgi:hypothetical protein